MRRYELAERVIELRERAELTQGEAAQKAGVGVTTWSNIETGTITRPHARTVIKMARALGVEPEELTAPKAIAPPSPEPERVSEEERRLAYLRITGLLANKMRDRWEKAIERNTFRYEEWNEAAEVAIEMDQALGEAIPVAVWRGNEWLPKDEWSALGYAFVSIGNLKSTIERAFHTFQSRFGEGGAPADVEDLSAVRERLNQETRTPRHTDEQARGAG